jgi:predicted AlkP superfamily pyrophosphatase or phosphodiesterase
MNRGESTSRIYTSQISKLADYQTKDYRKHVVVFTSDNGPARPSDGLENVGYTSVVFAEESIFTMKVGRGIPF